MEVVVIGGGPAGMMAAITSAENGNEVILIEKMKSLGRKLLITGKGRCNITSSLDMENFIKNIPGNGRFLFSCFQNFTNEDIIEFLKEQGLETKVERGNRVFPVTDKSQDVLQCFTKKLKELNVKIMYNSQVIEIITQDVKNNNQNNINEEQKNKKEKKIAIKGIRLANGKEITADKIILATGGKSYPLTGSTGDGYKLVHKLGHTITEIKPSLVPLECYQKHICQELQGLSLRNVKIKLEDIEKNKIIYEDFGEMLFTHFGVSGPTILSGSSHLVRYKNVEKLLQDKKIKLAIDLKPALTEEKLNDRILRDFEQTKNKQFKNSLDKLLPQKMINIVIDLSKINPKKQVNEITMKERIKLIQILKNLELQISDFRPIDEAIITSGGINIKEINPKTMESKIVKGLYFAGEVIDVDAYTGGFNLQIAYSTGYTAGQLASNS
ncbi:MAG: NAD(P)/FAD-dependent oxidoreductase [Clostridia bacterium]|nr:NAD(P)/FAD-dependent oxidoreductase [Clostridia bacterium]